MKIIIYQNREVSKENSKIGNDSENKVETLEFEFPEEYKDFTKYIEFQTKDEKYVDLIEDDKYIITRAIAKYGKIKAQIVLRNSLENDVAVFKSDIFELKVSKSINATIDVPIEYPTWIDNLTRLKQDIEHAEHERVSNEEERQTAEEARQENFTEMQKTVKSAVSNIKDLKEDYNTNAKKKTDEFNNNFEEKQKAINDNAEAKTTAFGENAEAQTKTFNTNSDDKLAEYNKNHTAKMKEFGDNYDTKTKTFDDNAAAKLDEYNKNDKTKTDAYNNNASNKEETFNTNAADKQNKFDENASDKLAEYNQNAKELINKVEQVQAENEALKAENKLIKEQIPSASASGNNIHIEDSGTLDFEWKIKGGHKQETREGYNLIDIQNNNRIYMNLTTVKKHENYENGILFNFDYDSDYEYHNTYRFAYIYYPFKKNKQYRLSWKTQNLGKTSQNLQCYLPELEQYLDFNNEFTPKNDTNWIAIFENNENFVEGYKVAITDVMLTEGSEIKPYEQYGVSPSPDYPSEIETVGSNVNFIPTNPDEWEQGTISNGKNMSSTTRIRSKDFIDIVEGEDYYLSIQDNQYRFVNIVLYKDDNTYLNAYSSYDIAIKKEYFLKVNFPTGCKKIRFVIRKVDDTSSIIPSEIDVIKPKLEKGTVQTPWSPYNQGSVEIDVVNKNLLDKNNEKKGITINAAGIEESSGSRSTTQYIKVDKNKKVLYVNWSGKTGKQNPGYTILLSYDSNKKLIKRQPTFNETSSKNWTFDISNASFIKVTYDDLQVNNGEYGVENTIISYEKTEYEEHQSQTAIMPIQQEMLEGDYVADVEHHEWGKIILTGNESWNKSSTTEIDRFSYNTSDYPAFAEGLSNCFLVKKGISLETGILIFNAGTQIVINFSNYGTTTLEEFKAWLKSKYDEGSPVIIYYKLAEPLNLELTVEQKSIRDTKLYTYKNITNIDVSDELASIDVEYKKNPATEHDDLQNQIDEIKQLISTPETSALLLDNLQKDVESEVE